MKKIVGISFLDDERLYYLKNNIENIPIGSHVICSTENGVKYGIIFKISDEVLNNVVVGSVVRVATEKDEKENEKNIKDQRKAYEKCIELVNNESINMKIIRCDFSFDRAVLLIYFFSEERVDFRNLAKQMASLFKTRIEFRQVGIRDKSRIVGGIGPCGRRLCCSTFLYDFDSISISMAKNQMLALNPNKINGVCGRLLCCLNYEDEMYREFRKNMPVVGKKVKIDDKDAKVISVDLYNQKYIVEFDDRTTKEILVQSNGKDK